METVKKALENQLLGTHRTIDMMQKPEKENGEFWERYRAYLNSPEWQERHHAVLSRCQGICEGCRKRAARQVHHLTYQNVGNEFLFQLIGVCNECHARIHPEALSDETPPSLPRATTDPDQSFKTVLADWISDLEGRHERIVNSGVCFGIPMIDAHIGAVQRGEICLIGSKTSGGKTALTMQAVDYSTFDKQLPVRIFSLEMTRMQLCDRMASRRAGISMKSFRIGLFKEGEFQRIAKYVDQVANSAVFINQKQGLGISDIISILRKDKEEHGIQYAVVDYLQLVESLVRRNGNREQEVADISTRLKSLALELDMPIIVTSQLNRQGQTRESDRIVHDADIGLCIRRDEDQPEDPGDPKGINITVTLEKVRNGERGIEVPLRFVGEYQRFEERREEPEESDYDSPNFRNGSRSRSYHEDD